MKTIQLIGASKVFVCDNDFTIITDGGIAFESSASKAPAQTPNKIVAIGKYETLKRTYPDGVFYEDMVILPAFINAHIHFEFGNNITSFVYGGFEKWLESVMKNRDDVLADIKSCVQASISEQLKSGVGSVGAISSYGQDLDILADSALRVVYFNEAIGSAPSALDFLYENFLARYNASKRLRSHRFTPAIALHSPYSVHSVLAKKVLSIAKQDACPVSAHFLESRSERQWLQNGSGWFKHFYENILKAPSAKPLYTIEAFLDLFKGLPALFTHCLWAELGELKKIQENGGVVVSCPRSNRLLCGSYLDLNRLDLAGLSPIFATDGKSSNRNLDMLDELRCALFAYPEMPIEALSQMLILGATNHPANALGLDNGVFEVGKCADISVFACPEISKSHQESLQFLLHAKEVQTLYINGDVVIENLF
ncbi:metal-dependent hydrolase [Helicobacter sp. 11S02596-1]|uniref:aminofutalosine deaminase family hydrolase n=1 Tax=Helicobacter sp. 11S02596-1 TaxID=1476194 RepID=UPI000BA677B5|nr:metal-dependent hydrolase [Helicobacter sp. 11S02596-1]PAF44852.1 hypothetical protein BJI48_02370 [Helicobacter sp. 11S02596-1]